MKPNDRSAQADDHLVVLALIFLPFLIGLFISETERTQ
jgi:hypothetical protein